MHINYSQCVITSRQIITNINTTTTFSYVAFSALTLLVGWQEVHSACKKWGEWWRWALVSPD